MKLEIIKGKKPLTCLDIETAVHFIGKECYFSDDLDNFEYLDEFKCKLTVDGDYSNMYKGKLLGIFANDNAFIVDKDDIGSRFDYCLPAEWVQERKKPKYRPYKDVEEFFDDVGCTLGDVIRFRKKDTTEEEYHTLLTGFKGNARVNIGLGDGGYYSLNDLFSLFELYTSNGWRPFGIEE